jgi:arabinan endo-1,5-alpha-L-arabinosidase
MNMLLKRTAVMMVVILTTGGFFARAEEIIDSGARNTHDPCIIKQGNYYYVFSTGITINSIEIRRSTDLHHWEFLGGVFDSTPAWVLTVVPRVSNLWAPDISYRNGKYYLYYSASTFGSNRSCIGLVSNMTLDPADPNYLWVDEGEVIRSRYTDYNAIDGNAIQDQSGQWWLSFGSFWTGIKLTPLNATTGKPTTTPPTLYSIASRPSTAIEAPFIIYRSGYYYLFVSFDSCCQGVNSTYNIRVGRSASVTGPYLDRNGVSMMNGGGTLVLQGDTRWKGQGHNAILSEDGQDYLVHHAYDALYGGWATLRIEQLEWSEDLWPVAQILAGDLNFDASVNLTDFNLFAPDWIGSIDEILWFADNWLNTTQP